MSSPILTATSVSVNQFGADSITDISVELSQGDVLAIIGPNGAGKTTLMKALLGLVPYTGTITWKPEIKIGYVPQHVSIARSFPLTVQEFFTLKSERSFFSKKMSAEIIQLLEHVGVKKLLEKRLSELSGGELQRVLIAHALVGGVTTLCLDEPSAGIDIGGGETVYGLLREFAQEEHRTIILISHDIDVVFKYANQVLCIDKRMICKGKPRSVLTSDTIERMYGHEAGVFNHHNHHAHV